MLVDPVPESHDPLSRCFIIVEPLAGQEEPL